jgi:hypothetical protein
MLGLLLLHAEPLNRVLLAEKTKGIVSRSALVKGAQSLNIGSFD